MQAVHGMCVVCVLRLRPAWRMHASGAWQVCPFGGYLVSRISAGATLKSWKTCAVGAYRQFLACGCVCLRMLPSVWAWVSCLACAGGHLQTLPACVRRCLLTVHGVCMHAPVHVCTLACPYMHTRVLACCMCMCARVHEGTTMLGHDVSATEHPGCITQTRVHIRACPRLPVCRLLCLSPYELPTALPASCLHT